MSELNLIKTVLFNASTTQEAITRLSELGFTVRECTFTHNGYHIQADQINFVDVTFWQTKSLRCPLAVCINGNLFDYEERQSFLAGQCETVETPVPAASPETTGQRPVTDSGCCLFCGFDLTGFHDVCDCERQPPENEPSTDSVDKPLSAIQAALSTPEVRLAILRTERRLKNSRVKGLSS